MTGLRNNLKSQDVSWCPQFAKLVLSGGVGVTCRLVPTFAELVFSWGNEISCRLVSTKVVSWSLLCKEVYKMFTKKICMSVS